VELLVLLVGLPGLPLELLWVDWLVLLLEVSLPSNVGQKVCHKIQCIRLYLLLLLLPQWLSQVLWCCACVSIGDALTLHTFYIPGTTIVSMVTVYCYGASD
jgi:hypothetical protein